jgi:hypothetical protein
MDGVPEAMKPKLPLAPAPRAPFQPTSVAVTVVVPLTVAFHADESPPLGNVHDTVQPAIAEDPAVTLTSPCQLPDQPPTALITAEQVLPPLPLVVVVVVAGRDVVVVVVVVGRDVVVVVVVGGTVVVVVGRDVVVVVVPPPGDPFTDRFVAGPLFVVHDTATPVLAEAPGAITPLYEALVIENC